MLIIRYRIVAKSENEETGVTLSPNGTVAGVLVDAAGKAAGGVRVIVVRDDRGASESIRPPATTTADGRFQAVAIGPNSRSARRDPPIDGLLTATANAERC